MKIVAIIAQVLLGLIFLVFGLNGFINFLHGTMPGGLAGEFLSVLIRSHYVYFVSGVQVIAAVFLLVNRFVPLAVALLAPVIACILAYHFTMQISGLPVAIFVAILWLILAYRLRTYFAPLFTQKTGCGTSGKTAA